MKILYFISLSFVPSYLHSENNIQQEFNEEFQIATNLMLQISALKNLRNKLVVKPCP